MGINSPGPTRPCSGSRPTDQGFGTFNPVVIDVHFGLIKKNELFIAQGQPHAFFECQPILGLGVHFTCEKPVPAAAIRFGVLHGAEAIFQEPVEGLAVRGIGY